MNSSLLRRDAPIQPISVLGAWTRGPACGYLPAVKFFAARPHKHTLPVTRVTAEDLPEVLESHAPGVRRWVAHHDFSAKPGQALTVPDGEGAPGGVLLAVPERPSLWDYAAGFRNLRPGRYAFDESLPEDDATAAALGFALEQYRFTRYRAADGPGLELVWPAGADRAEVTRLTEAIHLARDLVNTPAEDMGPDALADVAAEVGHRHRASVEFTVGEELLEKGYAAIHTVGRAAEVEPRLVDLRWGDESHPRLTLVGKGVCFDSGGLDLKTAAGMQLMKKDMGGAAIALGLAHAIMDAGLPVRLRVLLPAVENAVSGRAFRPLDVIRTRHGLTVEVGNTDAEGRLILCEPLAEAASESPDLLLDFATLTGAARVALGTELPAVFATDDRFAQAWIEAGEAHHDPVWRMPLFAPYAKQLDSRVADISSTGGSYGGAITAALFLHRFVGPDTRWCHMDVMAYNLEARPGRPAGGEAMGLRSAFAALKARYLSADSGNPSSARRR